MFSQNMDNLEKKLTKETLHENDCKTTLTKLKTMFTKVFKSELINPSNFYSSYSIKQFKIYTGMEAHLFKDTMIGDMEFIEKYMIETILHEREIQKHSSKNERSSSKTDYNNSVKESISNSKTKDMHAIKYKMSKEKERYMAYLRSLHSHLQMQTQEKKVDTNKALDAGFVIIESSSNYGVIGEVMLKGHILELNQRNLKILF
ncbi:hypothetical protein Tco_0651062 [Tanacetum coccineum]